MHGQAGGRSMAGSFLARLLLIFYLIELMWNRILIRILIFIPNSKALSAMATITAYGGRFALNATSPLGALIIVLQALERRGLSLAFTILFAVLIITDYLGLVKLYWLLSRAGRTPSIKRSKEAGGGPSPSLLGYNLHDA